MSERPGQDNLQVEAQEPVPPLQGYVEQYSAAYQAHRATYALRVPPPEARDFPEPQPEPPGWKLANAGTLLQLALLVGASMVVSGSRTIPEFGDVGVPAFVMLEMGLITYAFIRTSRNYSAERHKTLGGWVSAGMYMAFIVLLAANLDAVLTRQGVELPAEVDLVIDAFVAISAPVLALISGDVLGMYSIMQRQSRKKDADDYQVELAGWLVRRDAHEALQRAAVDVWREGLNAAWNTTKKQMGVQLPARTSTPIHSPVHSFAPGEPAVRSAANERMNDGGAANSATIQRMNRVSRTRAPNGIAKANRPGSRGYTKNMSAKELAAAYIRTHRASNAELMTMSTDELHALLLREGVNIGRTSAHEARKLVLDEPSIQPAFSNGHHSE